MGANQHVLRVETNGPGLLEITEPIQHWVSGTSVESGLLTLFLRHTSASLLIQENADPSVRRDLEEFFRRFVPRASQPEMGWITHRAEGPDDMPAHIRAAVLPVHLSIPIMDGQLALGTWQGIYLYEHRDRPHRRDVVLHVG